MLPDVSIDGADRAGMPIRVDWSDESGCFSWFSLEDSKELRHKLKAAERQIKSKVRQSQ